jgi:hypothetical protein
MDDASGKFALVMLRANQVRVHHKRTKHEYVFAISNGQLKMEECVLRPNPAALTDPRDHREEAVVAAEWFSANRTTAPAAISDARRRSGWVSA